MKILANKRILLLGLNVAPYDAVTRSTFDFYQLLNAMGAEVLFFANCLDVSLSEVVKERHLFWQELKDTDIIFYHYSIEDTYLKQLAALSNQKHVYYHGITPPELIKSFFEQLAAECQRGIDDTSFLQSFNSIVSNSWFNLHQVQSKFSQGKYMNYYCLPPFLSMEGWDCVQPLKPSSYSEKFNTKKLLYVGRRFPHKNIEYLIHLLSNLDDTYELLLVGHGSVDVYENKINELINYYGRQKRIQFLNSMSKEELKFLFQNADAFVSGSLHEGFSVPIVEAMKHRLPVFVTDNGAMAETLVDPQGLLPADYKEAAVKIQSYFSCSEKIKKLIEVQSQIYLNCYSEEVNKSKYVDYITKNFI